MVRRRGTRRTHRIGWTTDLISIALIASTLSCGRTMALGTFSRGFNERLCVGPPVLLQRHTVTNPDRVGVMSHLWHTGASQEDLAAMGVKLVISYRFDNEPTPSLSFDPVEASGQFFGAVQMQSTDTTLSGVPSESAGMSWVDGTRWATSNTSMFSAGDKMGKNALTEGWHNNFQLPFNASVEVTAQYTVRASRVDVALRPNCMRSLVRCASRARGVDLVVPCTDRASVGSSRSIRCTNGAPAHRRCGESQCVCPAGKRERWARGCSLHGGARADGVAPVGHAYQWHAHHNQQLHRGVLAPHAVDRGGAARPGARHWARRLFRFFVRIFHRRSWVQPSPSSALPGPGSSPGPRIALPTPIVRNTSLFCQLHQQQLRYQQHRHQQHRHQQQLRCQQHRHQQLGFRVVFGVPFSGC
jgi:hypothetical protein